MSERETPREVAYRLVQEADAADLYEPVKAFRSRIADAIEQYLVKQRCGGWRRRMKCSTLAPRKSVEVLADEIFGLVEDVQGKGFVSDGLGALPNKDVLLATVRNHLRYTELAAHIMRSWLKKQDGGER